MIVSYSYRTKWISIEFCIMCKARLTDRLQSRNSVELNHVQNLNYSYTFSYSTFIQCHHNKIDFRYFKGEWYIVRMSLAQDLGVLLFSQMCTQYLSFIFFIH